MPHVFTRWPYRRRPCGARYRASEAESGLAWETVGWEVAVASTCAGRVGPGDRLVVGASGGSSRAKVTPGSAGRNPPTEAMLLAPLSSLEVLPMRCRSVLTSSVTKNCLRNLIWHYIGADIGDIS